jgi:hypothetical protein
LIAYAVALKAEGENVIEAVRKSDVRFQRSSSYMADYYVKGFNKLMKLRGLYPLTSVRQLTKEAKISDEKRIQERIPMAQVEQYNAGIDEAAKCL